MKDTFANLISILGGEMAIRFANLAAAVVIARVYGPASLGLYATSLAFATIVGTLGDNGLSISAISEVSRRLHDIDRVVSSLYVTKTALFSIAVAAAATITSLWHPSRVQWLVGSLVLAKVLVNSYAQLHFGVLKSLDRMGAIGIIQTFHASGLLFGIVLVYIRHLSIVQLLLILVAGQLLEFLISGALVYRKGIRFVRVPLSDCWRLFAVSTPIGVACLLASVILRMDVLAISALYSPAQVGHFAAANNGLIIVYLVGALFGNVLLPEMVKMASSKLDAYIARWKRIICASTIPVAIGIAVIAKSLIVMVYGVSFADAGTLASIMVLALPFIILNYLYFNRAIALQQNQLYLSVYVKTALLALILDCALAYKLGPIGVAIAILIREAFMFAMYGFSVRRAATSQFMQSSPLSVQSE